MTSWPFHYSSGCLVVQPSAPLAFRPYSSEFQSSTSFSTEKGGPSVSLGANYKLLACRRTYRTETVRWWATINWVLACGAIVAPFLLPLLWIAFHDCFFLEPSSPPSNGHWSGEANSDNSYSPSIFVFPVSRRCKWTLFTTHLLTNLARNRSPRGKGCKLKKKNSRVSTTFDHRYICPPLHHMDSWRRTWLSEFSRRLTTQPVVTVVDYLRGILLFLAHVPPPCQLSWVASKKELTRWIPRSRSGLAPVKDICCSRIAPKDNPGGRGSTVRWRC